jgi:hypothetical protein
MALKIAMMEAMNLVAIMALAQLVTQHALQGILMHAFKYNAN